MKMNFIGMAIVAGLLAGCQTAQRQDYTSVDFDAMYPGYGSDREGVRAPASADPIIETVLKEISKVSVKAVGKDGKAITRTGTEDFLRFVNRTRGAEVTRVKNDVFNELSDVEKKKIGKAENVKLDEQQVKRLSESAQSEISAAYLARKSMMDMPQLNALREQVENVRAKMAGTDVKTFREQQNAKLLSDNGIKGNTQGFSEKTNMSAQQIIDNANASNVKAGKLNASFKNLEDVLVKAASGNKEAQEIQKAIFDMKKAAGEVWKVSGDSHLIPETCENLDLETVKSYTKLLQDIRKQFDEYPKNDIGRVKCSNINDITAWVAARFQQSLGRRGVSAWTAVQEMTFCNYLKTDVATASRKMASLNGGEVPEKVECK